jgi:hypothetical protein
MTAINDRRGLTGAPILHEDDENGAPRVPQPEKGEDMTATGFRRRLREYDWLAALIELVIVIAGILIALQVSNWNQDRTDRTRGARYAHRLAAEIVTDRRNMDEALAFWNQVGGFGKAAMAHAEHGTLAGGDRWKTVIAYYQASQLFPFELEDTTFVEMRDSGGLALIADESLRKRIADYYRMGGAGLRANILFHRPEYRPEIRGLTPWAVQEYIWSHCFRQGKGASQDLLDCASPLSDDDAQHLLDAYRASPTLLSRLREWMSVMAVSAIVIENLKGDADALEQALKAVDRG